MIDGLHGDVDVKRRPIEMTWASKLDIHDRSNGGVSKPGEVLKGHEDLSTAKEKPQAVLRDVRNFNLGSVSSTLCGFHPHAPEPAVGRSQRCVA
jgi:hypothetical protein